MAVAVGIGLLASWHLGTAAGASIAASAIALAALSGLLVRATTRFRRAPLAASAAPDDAAGASPAAGAPLPAAPALHHPAPLP
ncbi:hypothetical protein NS354_06210 [Leucobacter chromiiresistens]|uniref:Uncharacterized protein n=1 Tax=Leucobacter chromiiresistens TaxID=1079994 RepID=A0A147EP84_9MICO|nr:hypothetical protein NS354_06210 [Leucobacter chromiiresistens]